MPDGTRVLVGRTAQSEGEIDPPKVEMTEAQAKAEAEKMSKGKASQGKKSQSTEGSES